MTRGNLGVREISKDSIILASPIYISDSILNAGHYRIFGTLIIEDLGDKYMAMALDGSRGCQ